MRLWCHCNQKTHICVTRSKIKWVLLFLMGAFLLPVGVLAQNSKLQLSPLPKATPGGVMVPVPSIQSAPLGYPKSYTARQIQQKQYPLFEAKLKPLYTALNDAYQYLQTADASMSLQRIAAFNGNVKLELDAVHRKLTKTEQQYRSLWQMEAAAKQLEDLTHYWRKMNKQEAMYGITAKQTQAKTDKLDEMREKLRVVLSQLQSLSETKDKLNNEVPY